MELSFISYVPINQGACDRLSYFRFICWERRKVLGARTTALI